MTYYPLISVLTVVKNRVHTIERCMQSVLRLDYPNVEYVVQDGGSTDGTESIIARYAAEMQVDCYKWEPDSCAEEGFFRGLRHCNGDLITVVLSDEEILPHAAKWAVDNLLNDITLGVIFGEMYVTNLDGNIMGLDKRTAPISVQGLLTHSCWPLFAASWFKRSALLEMGLDRQWTYGHGEFEFWLRLAQVCRIQYVPGVVTKYAMHPGAVSNDPRKVMQQVPHRIAFINRWFTEHPNTGGLRDQAMAGMYLWYARALLELGDWDNGVNCFKRACEYGPPPGRMLETLGWMASAGFPVHKLIRGIE